VLAIVAYPGLERADREWIEAIRTRHDPQAALIGVHFTLVFPADSSASDLAAEASAVAAATAPIPFAIRRASATPDALGGAGGHVFLVPDEGAREIAALHHRLYQGVMRPHLRADIPFTPHMTVAACPDMAACEHLARAINREPRGIRGALESVEVIEVGASRVRSIGAFVLGRPALSKRKRRGPRVEGL